MACGDLQPFASEGRWCVSLTEADMRRYFFHLRDESRLDPDELGVELPDAEAAYAEAVKPARSMKRTQP